MGVKDQRLLCLQSKIDTVSVQSHTRGWTHKYKLNDVFCTLRTRNFNKNRSVTNSHENNVDIHVYTILYISLPFDSYTKLFQQNYTKPSRIGWSVPQKTHIDRFPLANK